MEKEEKLIFGQVIFLIVGIIGGVFLIIALITNDRDYSGWYFIMLVVGIVAFIFLTIHLSHIKKTKK